MQMAAVGATAAGGCNRLALTAEDTRARQLFLDWCLAAGCEPRVDTMGNLFVRRAGRNNNLPAVMTGSHLDTQATGGKFDGVYGVLAGLEVIRSLNDANISTQAPLEVCVWTNEEGARFAPAMLGSGVWSGVFDLDYGHSRQDKQGISVKSALETAGFLGDSPCVPGEAAAFVELHIEQGPILEQQALQIGVVEGVQGIRWYDLILRGDPVHAGPTPMASRRDPVSALHPLLASCYQMVADFGPDARLTCGDLSAQPGARNTVPQQVTVSLDLRHPREDQVEAMEQALLQLVQQYDVEHAVDCQVERHWHSPAVAFNADLVDLVAQQTQAKGYRHKRMVSGAGHDAVYVSRCVPTAMIFVPCAGGISHNEAEYASPEDLSAGAEVLLATLVALAT